MKFLLMSDVHVDERQPVNRTDLIEITMQAKLKQVIDIATNNGCTAILQAGDFTNRPTIANRTICRLQWLMRTSPVPMYFVAGQHDLLFRSLENINETAMGVLASSGLYHRLSPTDPVAFGGIHVYGCDWGSDIPTPLGSCGQNILVVHASVGNKLFADHKITPAEDFIKNNPMFDLILVGDYHFPFIKGVVNKKTKKVRRIINTGVLIRRSIDESEVEPAVAVYDTETREITWHCIDHVPNVFKDRKEAVEGVNELVEEVLANIQQAKTISSDYRESVLRYVNSLDHIDDEVRATIFNILDQAEEVLNA